MKNLRSSPICKSLEQEQKELSEIVAQKGASLEKFVIDDDGYQIKIVVPGESITLNGICTVVDGIDFKGYLVNECIYKKDGIEAVLVPICQNTMNDYVWDYVGMYLSEHDAIEALSIAIGVLEHLVAPLPKEVRDEYEHLLAVIFT